jgi:methionine synthase I (cobalamin-dependent)
LILQGNIGENDSSARANLDCPDAVLALHFADIEAGADAILTNTFATSRPSLKKEGRESIFERTNRQAVALARQAAGDSRLVIGSIGPVPIPNPDAYREQADLLAECGVDALILETHTFEAAEIGARAALREVQLPVMVSLYQWPSDPKAAADTFHDLGVSAIGANCGNSSLDVLTIIERLVGQTTLPLLAKPSASSTEGPTDFGLLASKLLNRGVRMIGGCCGATSAHLAAMRAEIGSPRA